MANYFYVTINSEKMTQEVANEIFNKMASLCLIRDFSFHPGYLRYNTRNLVDITDILNHYNFNDEEICVKDEFDMLKE